MEIASLVVAMISLTLSVFVFWRTQMRKADLVVAPTQPTAYGARLELLRAGPQAVMADQIPPTGPPPLRLYVRLALVFQNRGARDGVVQDMRISAPQWWSDPDPPAKWMRSGVLDPPAKWMKWDGIGAESLHGEDDDAMPQPFLVPGDSSVSMICRFRTPVNVMEELDGSWQIAVELQPAGSEWRRCHSFTLHIDKEPGLGRQWFGHWNDPPGDS